jgi:hypothetical protein
MRLCDSIPGGSIAFHLRMQNREGESALTYSMKYGPCAGKGKLVKTQPGIKICHEHDRGVLPIATCKGQIGFLRWRWITVHAMI